MRRSDAVTRLSGAPLRRADAGPVGPAGTTARWAASTPFGTVHEGWSSTTLTCAVWGPGIPTVLLIDEAGARGRTHASPARTRHEGVPSAGLALVVGDARGTVTQPRLRSLLAVPQVFTRDGCEVLAQVGGTAWTMRAVKRLSAELRRAGVPVVRSGGRGRYELLPGATPEDLALAVALDRGAGSVVFPLLSF